MKILKTASGKKTVKMSKSEWASIGKKAGWMKISQSSESEWVKKELQERIKKVIGKTLSGILSESEVELQLYQSKYWDMLKSFANEIERSHLGYRWDEINDPNGVNLEGRSVKRQ